MCHANFSILETGRDFGKNNIAILEIDVFRINFAQSFLDPEVEALQRQGIYAPKSKLVRSAIEQSSRAFAIGDICLQIPTVSRELVKKVVQQMRAEGLLEPVGKGRGAQWQKC